MHLRFAGAPKFPRSRDLAGPRFARDEGGVDRELLGGGRLGQKLQVWSSRFDGRDDLIVAEQGHMNGRSTRDQPAIALVGDDDDGSGLGHGDVGPRDPHPRGEEFLAELFPGQAHHQADVGRDRTP